MKTNMSCSLLGFAIAQKCPINIGAKVFAHNGPLGFALNVDCERLAAWAIAVCDVLEMASRCFAASREIIAIRNRESHEKGFELVHERKNTPFGVVVQEVFTPFREFTKRLITVSISP